MADLFSLFDEKLQNDSSLVAGSPQNLESLSAEQSEQEFIVKKSKAIENVEFKLDYSDFRNFVFFNSAEDYFNVCGERMLNEYPYDGTRENIQDFIDESDGYQKYLIKVWPKSSGHLRFHQQSGSYVKFNDLGKEDGVTKSSLLSPGTGSISVEMWFRPSSASLAASNTAQVLFQKATATGDGYSVYLSGSNIYFRVVSGSSVNEISTEANGDGDRYVAAVMDRSLSTGSLFLYTGSNTQFPVLAANSSLTFYNSLDLGSSSFYICSGTISGKSTSAYTGSIGEVRVWRKARQLSELSSSFNTRMFAQKNLVGLWTFAEPDSLAGTAKTVVLDHSGRKLDGTIINYHSSLRASGSITVSSGEPILTIDEPSVLSFVREKQLSGSEYDRSNGQIITRLFPEAFFIKETEDGTRLFEKFLYVIARMFDEIKASIGQFTKIYTVNYTDFNQAPDALLADVAKFYGWDFVGNFLSADAMQYLVGRGVLGNLDTNVDLDTKLYEIKNELWRRCISNLMYIYKTKGTRESIKALLNSYGVNENLFKIKEYVLDSKSGLVASRVSSEKSVLVAAFGSGSLTGSIYRTVEQPSSYLSGTDHTIELRVRFPLTSSLEIPATVKSGTLWTYSGGTPVYYSLVFDKDSYSSRTGSLYLTSSVGLIAQLTGVGIFDGEWKNISTRFSYVSGTADITVLTTDESSIESRFCSSSVATSVKNLLTSSLLDTMIVGSPMVAFGSANDTWRDAQYWAQEFRVWSSRLDDEELEDHALNFQSYGRKRVRNDRSLKDHWRLDGEATASFSATDDDQFTIYNIAKAPQQSYVTGTNFAPSVRPFKRFLNSYSFIAGPDGWTDDKIRVIDSTKMRRGEEVQDSSIVSLELNMVDALNEDLSQMMASMDELNSILGVAASKYQESYSGLSSLRQKYFTRLQGKLRFNVFADMLDFFDRSFIQMVRRLVPARATFVGDELVVESHMLERPKVQYKRAGEQEKPIDIGGSIRMVGTGSIRFSSAVGDVTTVKEPLEDLARTSGIALHITFISVPSSVKG